MADRRLTGWVLAVVCIVVAAIAVRLSEPGENYQVVTAPLGQLTAYNDGAAGADQLRVVTDLRLRSEQAHADGRFVVVRITVEAPRSVRVHVQHVELHSGDRVYQPYGSGEQVFAAPGFRTYRDVAFEVDPAGLAGLTVQAWDAGLVTGYHQRLEVPLGITAANADYWRQSGTGRFVDLSGDDTTEGLR